VIASSSTDNTCAEALNSDHVSLRRFLTSSITSGHALRKAAISKLPGTFAFGGVLGADYVCFSPTGFTTPVFIEGATSETE